MNILTYYVEYLKIRKKKLDYYYVTNPFGSPWGEWWEAPKKNRYDQNDLRKKFIDEYIKRVKRKLNIRIFTCTIDLNEDSSCLNFDIYLDNFEKNKSQDRDEINKKLEKIFYRNLAIYKLPGIKDIKIEFRVANYQTFYQIEKCYKAKMVLDKAPKMKESLFLTTVTDNGVLLVLKDEFYEQYINDKKQLKKYRNFLIKQIKQFDTDNRIDLNKIEISIVPSSEWKEALKKGLSGREKCEANAIKIEPITDENEGRTMMDYNPINERRFYRAYVFLSKAMLLLLIISLIVGSLIKLLFLGLLLPIYVIISAIFFFAYLKPSKIFSIIIVGLLLLFSVVNYKYILDTKIFFTGKASVESGVWEELSNDSYDYIMIKNKPVRNYYTIGKINDKVFKIKENLINGEKYEIKYLPNTNLVLQVTSYH